MWLIDADALKSHVRSFTGMFTDDGFFVSIDAVLGAIDFATTVDAEPVRHGEWRIINVPKKWGGSTMRCSECNTGGTKLWNYCPNCGAKMKTDGGKQDAD